jgi:hypothetical protein
LEDGGEIWVVGCVSDNKELRNSVFEALEVEELRKICDSATENGVKKATRKPVLFEVRKRHEGSKIKVLMTPPGQDQVRLYAQALNKVSADEGYPITVRAFYLPEVAQNPEVFQRIYGLFDEKAILRDTLRQATVVVGGCFDLEEFNEEPPLQRDFRDWKQSDTHGKSWFAAPLRTPNRKSYFSTGSRAFGVIWLSL